jgi:hypothetical protein
LPVWTRSINVKQVVTKIAFSPNISSTNLEINTSFDLQIMTMKVLKALAFMPSVLASGLSPIPIDSRSLSDIYAAAQKESGVLRVVHGGDGSA